jgi:hypothetical protein
VSAETLNPVQVEQRIRETANRIANSAQVCNDRYVAFLTADREYDAAYAAAFLDHDGPQTEKRYAAESATTEQREARDVADAAYRYADRLAKALQAELMAYQSINKSVLATYSAAGTGEW